MTMTGDETLTVPQVFGHPAILENEPVQASDLALARREEALEGSAAHSFAAGVAPGGVLRTALIDRVALDRALEQLPPGYRAAFILHDVEGYEHEEVAQILGCAVGTSKSQLHKARAKLRKILTQRS